MQINNIRFKNLSEQEKGQFEKYLDSKLPRIEEYARKFDGDTIKFFVEAEKFATKSAYKVKFEFEAPKIYLVVSEDDHTINEAVDLALDKLITRMKKEMKSWKKNMDKEIRRQVK